MRCATCPPAPCCRREVHQNHHGEVLCRIRIWQRADDVMYCGRNTGGNTRGTDPINMVYLPAESAITFGRTGPHRGASSGFTVTSYRSSCVGFLRRPARTPNTSAETISSTRSTCKPSGAHGTRPGPGWRRRCRTPRRVWESHFPKAHGSRRCPILRNRRRHSW
jgi:hypothetical protein